MKWEVFLDECYFHMWVVRPIGDRGLNSPQLFHFVDKDDAYSFKRLAEKATIASKAEQVISEMVLTGTGRMVLDID